MSIEKRLQNAEKRIKPPVRILSDGTICYDGPDDAKWPLRLLWVYVRNAPAHVVRAIETKAFTPTVDQMGPPRDYSMTPEIEHQEDWRDYIDDMLPYVVAAVKEKPINEHTNTS